MLSLHSIVEALPAKSRDTELIIFITAYVFWQDLLFSHNTCVTNDR